MALGSERTASCRDWALFNGRHLLLLLSRVAGAKCVLYREAYLPLVLFHVVASVLRFFFGSLGSIAWVLLASYGSKRIVY